MKPLATVFLSHAGGKDDEWTRWLEAVLRDFGLEVVVHYGSFPGGGQVAEHVHEALTKSEICACLFSPRYFSPERWTLAELAAALSAKKEGSLKLLLFKIGHVNPGGFYASLVATELYDYTESAAVRRVAKELVKIGVTVSPPSNTERPHDRPRYPGPGHPVRRVVPQIGGAAVENLIAESEDLAHAVTTVDEVSLDHIEEMMALSRTLARSYNYESPADILKRTLGPYRLTRAAQERVHSGERVSELQYVLGRLHAILSYATLDLGYDSAAATHARAVIRCAQNAAHSELEAWGRGTLSMILRFQGWNETSVDEALRGLEVSVDGSVLARLHAQAALSYVEVRDGYRAREHLKQSDAVVDQEPTSPEMKDGIFLFSRAKHHYYAGSAYADFGPIYARDAVTESEHAIDELRNGDLDEKSYSDELLAYVHLARGLYASDRLEEIPDALRELFATDPTYRTSWHVQWLERFVRTLQRGPSRGSVIAGEIGDSTAEFKEELENFASDEDDIDE